MASRKKKSHTREDIRQLVFESDDESDSVDDLEALSDQRSSREENAVENGSNSESDVCHSLCTSRRSLQPTTLRTTGSGASTCIHVRLGACRSVIYGLGESDVALLRKILQLRLRNFEPLGDRVGHHAHVHA